MGDSVIFNKSEVLNRPEFIADEDTELKHFSTEGLHPDNQFWHGEKCYVPVSYKAQRFKMRVNIVNPRIN